MRRYIMELVGTMFLVLTCSMVGNPLAIGIMLVVLAYIGANISGSYYNPAFSLAMWIRGKLSLKDMGFYMLFQLLGAFIAAAIYYLFAGKPFYPSPAPGVGYMKIVSVELLFTAFFVFVYLVLFAAKKPKSDGIPSLIIGFALLPIAFLGGTYNPALSVGPALFDLVLGGSAFTHIPAYLGGTFLGAGLGALFHWFIVKEE